MSKLNNENRELTIEELKEVAGGNVGAAITKAASAAAVLVIDKVDQAIGKLIGDPYYSRT